jgi:hypothetical protein
VGRVGTAQDECGPARRAAARLPSSDYAAEAIPNPRHPTGLSEPSVGDPGAMRFGRNVEVRPLGGGFGCLLMILVSVVASVLLTVVANLLLN